MRLLVVEDSEPVRLRLIELLGAEGLRIQSAATLGEARALLAEADLVSLDLQLPDGSGLDLIDAARQLDVPPTIFVLTGAPELTAQALSRGADRVFGKAGDIPQYLAAIESLVQARTKEGGK